jgi:hypothetical protein
LSQGRVAHDLMPVSHAFFHDGQGRAWQDRTWHCSMTASSPVSNLLFHPTSPPPPQCSISSTTSVVYIVLSDSPRCVLAVPQTLTQASVLDYAIARGAKGAARSWWWEGCFVPPACRQRMPARLPRLCRCGRPVHTIDSINKCDRFRPSGTRQPALAS